MSLVFSRRKHRVTVMDFLHDTTVDGYLYKYENNNNLHACSTCTHIEEFYPMTDLTELNYNNNNNEAPAKNGKREYRQSSLLEDYEQNSVMQYVGKNASLLASGVCQLLTEEDGEWTKPETGVICLIKDFDNRVFSLTLLDPMSHDVPAAVRWVMTITRRFTTSKEHDHLVTFTMETPPYSVCGLNFYDSMEAEEFHAAVFQQHKSYLQRRNTKTPKRKAPAPPTQSVGAGVLPFTGVAQMSAMGVEIDVQKEKKTNKKEKKGIFGFLTHKKKKPKSRPKIEISNPTNFQHINHMDELGEEERETFDKLAKTMEFDASNEEQTQLLAGIVKKKHADVKSALEQTERNLVAPIEPFQRQNSALSDTRSSIMIPKNGRGNTPRDIKKASMIKRGENVSQDRAPTPAPSNFGKFDPLNPNWDEDTPVDSTNVRSERVTAPPEVAHHHAALPPLPSEAEEILPPVPTRTVSRRSPLHYRRNTPPNLDVRGVRGPPSSPPRLQPRMESTGRSEAPSEKPEIAPHHRGPPVPQISVPAPSSSEVETTGNSTSTVPLAPPPPPPSLFGPPSPTPVAPPPPPPDLFMRSPSPALPDVAPPSPRENNSPMSIGSATHDRRSFLDEIQNVDKTKLLHSVDKVKLKPLESPTGENQDLLSSIQRQLDARRSCIGGLSDDDSSSEDSDDDWSD